MQTFVKRFAILSAIVVCGTSYAEPPVSVDDILKQADLTKLIGVNKAVNLIAQLKDPNASTTQVSDFTDFIAIGVTDPEQFTSMTEFTADQTSVKHATYDFPWIGVSSFPQSKLPALTLQEGFVRVKACMAAQNDPTPEAITKVIIYQSIFPNDMVYDYVFKDEHLPAGLCQEFIFNTKTSECQRGFSVSCHFNIVDPAQRLHSIK